MNRYSGSDSGTWVTRDTYGTTLVEEKNARVHYCHQTARLKPSPIPPLALPFAPQLM